MGVLVCSLIVGITGQTGTASILGAIWPYTPVGAFLQYWESLGTMENSFFGRILSPELANAAWMRKNTIISGAVCASAASAAIYLGPQSQIGSLLSLMVGRGQQQIGPPGAINSLTQTFSPGPGSFQGGATMHQQIPHSHQVAGPWLQGAQQNQMMCLPSMGMAMSQMPPPQPCQNSMWPMHGMQAQYPAMAMTLEARQMHELVQLYQMHKTRGSWPLQAGGGQLQLLMQ